MQQAACDTAVTLPLPILHNAEGKNCCCWSCIVSGATQLELNNALERKQHFDDLGWFEREDTLGRSGSKVSFNRNQEEFANIRPGKPLEHFL